MAYIKADQILPNEIIELIQKYVDGEYLYIPRKQNKRQKWGKNTGIRKELADRNREIYECFLNGEDIKQIAQEYFLSVKSIQRIVHNMKQSA